MCHGLFILTNSQLLFKSEQSSYEMEDVGTAIGGGDVLFKYLKEEKQLEYWNIREEVITDWFVFLFLITSLLLFII